MIVPAHDEAEWIGGCLDAVLASNGALPGAREIVVVANACTDGTAAAARDRIRKAAVAGWSLTVIETDQPGKPAAFNRAEAATLATRRIYLDADVTVSSPLIAALCKALDTDTPRYATGTAILSAPLSRVSQAYGRFWQTLPFMTEDAPGFGLFAVNAAGRARWETFPDTNSDDTFVRLHFAPSERIRLPSAYNWPLAQGFAQLVRVRRRQNNGVNEVAEQFPHLLMNIAVSPPGLGGIARRALRDPTGFCAYVGVALAVKTPLFAAKGRWDRGR